MGGNGEWLDPHTSTHTGTSIIQHSVVTIWWSDGDVWTRSSQISGEQQSILSPVEQKYEESKIVFPHIREVGSGNAILIVISALFSVAGLVVVKRGLRARYEDIDI